MNVRVRWMLAGVGASIVVGLLALFLIGTTPTDPTITVREGRRAWVVEAGQTVRLSTDDVRARDRYVCEHDGGVSTVDEAPSPGTVVVAGGFTVAAAPNGTVVMSCADPGNG